MPYSRSLRLPSSLIQSVVHAGARRSVARAGPRPSVRMASFSFHALDRSAEVVGGMCVARFTTASLPGGSYVGPDGFMELQGHPKIVTSSGRSKDRATAERLCALSEELTGVSYELDAPAAA